MSSSTSMTHDPPIVRVAGPPERSAGPWFPAYRNLPGGTTGYRGFDPGALDSLAVRWILWPVCSAPRAAQETRISPNRGISLTSANPRRKAGDFRVSAVKNSVNAGFLECWCCGSSFPEEQVVRLGQHPEVAVCLDWALFLNRRDESRPYKSNLHGFRGTSSRVRDAVVCPLGVDEP
jgi:hypothetical protein